MKNKRLIWTLIFLAILTLGSIGTDLFKKEHQDANKVVKVGILQFVTHDALDQIEKGIEDGLKEAGYKAVSYTHLDVYKRQTLFPETYFYHKDKLSEGGLFYLDGRTQERDRRIQLILSNMEEASTERFWILLENHDKDLDVSQILAKYPGYIPVIIRYQGSKETIVSQRYRVSKNEELNQELAPYVLKTVLR